MIRLNHGGAHTDLTALNLSSAFREMVSFYTFVSKEGKNLRAEILINLQAFNEYIMCRPKSVVIFKTFKI